MPLTPGTRLGPYEIASILGAGGMGEVYKARDTRLDRVVAVKVLPAGLAADPQFRERFDREARAISHLAHANICTLYDVGEHDGTPFLVMELLGGETLADRLTKGALPLAQALTIAIEVASALDAAHRAGLVHRDVKPGNIFLVRGGGAEAPPIAKLLDFGLAKSGRPVIAGAGLSMLPTTPPNITVQGTILGTFQYMAPEQIEGLEADTRTDIFAFGCVLFEMLTGKTAFKGKTRASLIGAILKDEPLPVSQAQPIAPASLDRIVATCLAKDPDDRWQSARDVMRVLKWVAGDSALTDGARMPSSAVPGTAWSRVLTWAPAATTLALALAALTLRVGSRPPPFAAGRPSRFFLSERLPAISGETYRSFAISPDARRVVYAAEGEGIRRLYVRDMQALETKPIAGTEGGTDPFFAPDGKRLGFWTSNGLNVIDIDGGSPVTIVQGIQNRGATWAPDDTIIYSPLTDSGLSRIPATGGTTQVVATPDSAKHERSYRWPHVLPGGDAVLFTIAGSDILSFDEARIAVRSLKTGEQHELLRGGSFPSYVAPGYLVYARAGALQAVRFNPASTAIDGTPTAVLDGIETYPTNGAAAYTVSGEGTLLYQRGHAIGPTSTMAWIDRTGRSLPVSVPPAAYQSVSIAPDGRSAAIDIDGANASIWILEFARNTLNRLTLEWSNNTPFWSPDGARVGFISVRSGERSLFWQPVDGRGGEEPLTPRTPGRSAENASFGPDGQTLAFDGRSPGTGYDVWVMAMDGKRQVRSFVQTKFNEGQPVFSPNGRWLAYSSNETGRPEVYVQPFPGPGRRVRISTDGGRLPLWSRDGRELFYRRDTDMMAVKVSVTAMDLSPQKPELLFKKTTRLGYDVAADGRFLMIEPSNQGSGSEPITVVLNWVEELKARLPKQ